MITYDDFKKLELKVAKILEAEKVEGSDKLVKLKITLGEGPLDKFGASRQIVAGIGKEYNPEDLLGKEIVIVANLEPRKLMGFESQGMLLAADNDGHPTLLMPDKDVPPGSIVK